MEPESTTNKLQRRVAPAGAYKYSLRRLLHFNMEMLGCCLGDSATSCPCMIPILLTMMTYITFAEQQLRMPTMRVDGVLSGFE